MTAETSRTTPSLDEGELSQHVDQRLFDDSMGTLTDHVVRKTVLGNKRRYTILFLLGERDEIARKELAEAIDDGSFDLSHYLSELVSVGLIARIGTSEGDNGCQTFYKITYLGRQELDADYRNITKHEPPESLRLVCSG